MLGVLMDHRIVMLGTGNAFLPHGRHHSFAMFDRQHIIDAPPTALAGMRRIGYSPADLRTIFITHVHGDHVFGFPFLLLERKYISDREQLQPLRVVGSSIVRERLTHLCQLAFPGSLESVLETVVWDEREIGSTDDGWTWERFEVHHEDAVEPHGYRFEHQSGANFVHSGDSGPCEALHEAIERSAIAILEMGFPDWVPSTHHHKPKDVEALALRCQTPLAITHTFIDERTEFETTLTKEVPRLPQHVTQLSDGATISWEKGTWLIADLSNGS